MKPRTARIAAAAATVVLIGFAFIGRAVVSADDGADMMADTLGFLVQGRFEAATPPIDGTDPHLTPPPPFRSRYGLFPSLVPLPFLAPVWPFRVALGAAVVDAFAASTWAVGCLAAALAFFRLARSLAPAASPLWIPGFLGGTCLWGYVASSFIEPWAGAGLAWAAATVLDPVERPPWRTALGVAGGCFVAFALRPVTLVTAPVLVLAALVRWRERADASGRALRLVGAMAGAVALLAASTWIRSGSATDLGYGLRDVFPFVHPLTDGMLGLTVSPGRGILVYAPVVIAALGMARRLSWSARLVCFGAPLALALVVSRWVVWHGGCCWGPRHLVPVLALLVAPAVLAPRGPVLALLAAGALVNLPGVLVAPGAWQSHAEGLTPPRGADWPRAGGDRTSEVVRLAPPVGHTWLLLRAVADRPVPAPWLAAGAVEGSAPPSLPEFLSPWLLRRAFGLEPVGPFVPRLLVRTSVAYLARGRPGQALLFAREALLLSPRDPDAARIVAGLEGRP